MYLEASDEPSLAFDQATAHQQSRKQDLYSMKGKEDFIRDSYSALEIRCYGDYAGQGAQHRIDLIIHALPSFFRPLCFA